MQSGFDHKTKLTWLGRNYYLPGIAGNGTYIIYRIALTSISDISYTNIPNIRIAYRYETLQEELEILRRGGPTPSPSRSLPFDGKYPYNRVIIQPPDESNGIVYSIYALL